MHVIVLAIGLAMGLAGIGLVAFASPFDPAAFGNTLIIAAVITIIGGLLLMGVASVLHQLRRIAQGVEAQPFSRALSGQPAPHIQPPFVPPLAAPMTGPQPAAERRSEKRPEPEATFARDEEPRTREDVAGTRQGMAAADDGRFDASEDAFEARESNFAARPKVPGNDADAPEIHDDVLGAREGHRSDDGREERFPSDVRGAEADRFAEAGGEQAAEEAAAQAAPPSHPSRTRLEEAADKIFEAVWAGATLSEPASKRAPDLSPPVPADLEPARNGESIETPRAAVPPSIFKSGVIDGMAYTLYTDGTIEAELTEGTKTFSSLDELRAYLAARE